MKIEINGSTALAALPIVAVAFVALLRPVEEDVSPARREIVSSLSTTTVQKIDAIVHGDEVVDAVVDRRFEDARERGRGLEPREVEIHELRGWRISRRSPMRDVTRQRTRYVTRVDATVGGQRDTFYLQLTNLRGRWVPGCRMHAPGFHLARAVGVWSLATCRPDL